MHIRTILINNLIAILFSNILIVQKSQIDTIEY